MNESGILTFVNQIFEIEKKIDCHPLEKSLTRHLKRMKDALEEAGYRMHDPKGESYDLTRLDCEAMVSGAETDKLRIVEVIKPIVYHLEDGKPFILQKAVVIVEQNGD